MLFQLHVVHKGAARQPLSTYLQDRLLAQPRQSLSIALVGRGSFYGGYGGCFPFFIDTANGARNTLIVTLAGRELR